MKAGERVRRNGTGKYTVLLRREADRGEAVLLCVSIVDKPGKRIKSSFKQSQFVILAESEDLRENFPDSLTNYRVIFWGDELVLNLTNQGQERIEKLQMQR